MASYSSDFQAATNLSRNELIIRMTELKAKELLINEDGYSFQIYNDGRFLNGDTHPEYGHGLFSDDDNYDRDIADYYDYTDIIEKVRLAANQLIGQRAYAARQETLKLVEEAEKRKIEKEREQLAALKAKYE